LRTNRLALKSPIESGMCCTFASLNRR
jgi:hypothetical protein